MKVIFVIVSMGGGGAERVISILANQFVKKGIDVTIMMTAGDEVAYDLDERIHLFCAGETSGGSMKKRMERIRNMRKYFKENRDSIIISFGPGTSFFAVAADLFLGHTFIISERNDPAICLYPKLRNIVYNRAKELVFQTEDALKCFPMGIQKKGCVIPNPISAKLPAPYEGERQKTIVAVGRLEEQKNYPLLIRAFQKFYELHEDYELHIYGQGSLKEGLEAQIEGLGLTDSVLLKGFQKNVPEQIKTAGIYVLSSDYEGVSNALLEAMAVGLPVVATDCPIGGCSLCIEDGRNGLLIPVGNEEELVKALRRIAEEPTLAADMGRRAASVRQRFSEENIAAQWEAILKRF